MKKEIRLVSYNCLFRIFIKLTKQVFLLSVICMAMFFQTGTAKADLPVTGYPVPELVIFDTFMQSYMADNGLEAGILAISKDGCAVYQRGFGYAYNGTDPLPENTPMRLASVEKPHTAAVIRHLVADGVIGLDDFVFDVGQLLRVGQRALLDASTSSSTYWPYNGVYGDHRFGSITVEHLLNHQGGWDRTLAYDPFSTPKTVEIGNLTGSTPPGRINIVRYMMAQPLQFDPGNPPPICDFNDIDSDGEDECLKTPMPCFCDSYSNYGYMLLSLIIEQENSPQQHTDVIRQRVLTPEIWVPSTEVIFGRTFLANQNQREPRYVGGTNCTNVYDPYGATVLCPYGSFDMESKTGEGNLVGSAAPLLIFLDNYNAWTGAPITSPAGDWKNGGLDGTSTRIQQRTDGFNVVALFPHSGGHGDEVVPQVYDLIDWATGIDWDSLKCIDGFWVDFNESSSGFGGHDDPFHTMNETLNATTDGTKLRFKPGTSNWTGTISKRMMLNTPVGTAIIGQ
jgi:CubicO group peptidase (beta-lactamase class C family)